MISSGSEANGDLKAESSIQQHEQEPQLPWREINK